MKLSGKFALAALFAGLMAAPALADENPRWGSLYVTGSLGGAWGKVGWTYYNDPAQQTSVAPLDFIAGLSAGIQKQFGKLVVGGDVGVNGGNVVKVGPDAPTFAARLTYVGRLALS